MDKFFQGRQDIGRVMSRSSTKITNFASTPSPMAANHMTDLAADVLIVSALPEEHDALVKVFGCAPDHDRHGQRTCTAEVAEHRVAIEPLHGMGNVGAASVVGTIARAWRARYVVLGGLAGGFASAGVCPGDVVVADQVVGYEPGRISAEGSRRRPEVYRPDFALLFAAEQVEADEWATAIRSPRPELDRRPRAHIGTVLSGEKVIAEAGAAADLRHGWPMAVAVEMESYGSALTTYRNGGRFLMVKGVSDLADRAKDDRWRAAAAEAAARFIRAVLHHVPTVERSGHDGALAVSGEVMLSVCWALFDDWRTLAYYFRIPKRVWAGFLPGEEPMGVWEWLDARQRIAELPEALAFIGRPDLADELLGVR